MLSAHAQNYQGKLRFDTTERRDFETLLVAELADALSLPVRNFSIEEVSRLPSLLSSTIPAHTTFALLSNISARSGACRSMSPACMT